jgi:hypothetical protein
MSARQSSGVTWARSARPVESLPALLVMREVIWLEWLAARVERGERVQADQPGQQRSEEMLTSTLRPDRLTVPAVSAQPCRAGRGERVPPGRDRPAWLHAGRIAVWGWDVAW